MPTGPGSLDAEGVYLFGEDDTDALASDMLNLLGDSVSTQFGLVRADVDTLGTRSGVFRFRWPLAADRTAQTGMAVGDFGLQVDTGVTYRYSGSVWVAWESDWISYAATLTGFVVGTGGTNSTAYRYEQGSVRVRFLFKFGTSGQTFPTDPKFTLPVNTAAQDHTYQAFNGFVSLHDNSAASLPRVGILFANATSVSQVTIYGYGNATTGLVYNISTTVPFTWAQNDILRGELTYTPA